MTDKPGYRRPQEGTQPEYLHPTYQSTNLRSPSKPLVFLPHSLSEITGPTIGAERVADKDNDLTAQHDGEPLGERIIIHGRVLDENGLPVPGILVESGRPTPPVATTMPATCTTRRWTRTSPAPAAP
jgi:protocatechuate 3,4-dioxygenase beta subunit